MLTIDYYSDILCVWAWIAEHRIEELRREFPSELQLNHHYIDVFGDVPGKIARQWQDRGGYAGYASHVAESCANFPEIPLHQDVWHQVRPASSANPHLALKATALTHNQATADALASSLRRAFFTEGANIGQRTVLDAKMQHANIDTNAVTAAIEDGSALAALMQDYQRARELGLKGSPSFMMNEGRQVLYGNVGYRVLSANIAELLTNHEQGASWC
ncbi:MAG: thioredoxin domain-containing protein [Halioglobus sp.]|nr:thioredoxin domain-containing protein [Halioglobus sp.]